MCPVWNFETNSAYFIWSKVFCVKQEFKINHFQKFQLNESQSNKRRDLSYGQTTRNQLQYPGQTRKIRDCEMELGANKNKIIFI